MEIVNILSDFVSNSGLCECLIELLDYEIEICNKILNDIPLTNDEYFFYHYLVPPHLLIKLLLNDNYKV